MRKLAIAGAFVLSFALAPLVAYAAYVPTYSDSVTGIELPNSTSATGNFVGLASGDLPGSWSASVNHAALPATVGGTALITGGTFKLATTVESEAAFVVGTFTDGLITFVRQASGCGKQYYTVQGALAVNSAFRGPGLGSFSATLVHYRAFIFGACRPLFASVAGTVGLY